MKINKRLNKLVNELTKLSVDSQGNLIESKVLDFTSKLKSLPLYQAIPALNLYLRMLKEIVNKTTLLVESPISLSSEELEKIKSGFIKDQPVSQMETKINPSLLGGLRVKIGDLVYDDSVREKINQVRENIIRV